MKATDVFSTLKLVDVLELPLAAAHDAADYSAHEKADCTTVQSGTVSEKLILHWFFRPLLRVL